VADTRRIFHLGRRVSGLRPSIRGGLWSSSVVGGPPGRERRRGGRRPKPARPHERTGVRLGPPPPLPS